MGGNSHIPLIPAQAGIQKQKLDPRFRGDERVAKLPAEIDDLALG